MAVVPGRQAQASARDRHPSQPQAGGRKGHSGGPRSSFLQVILVCFSADHSSLDKRRTYVQNVDVVSKGQTREPGASDHQGAKLRHWLWK